MKLIAIDLDGTLLSDDGSISQNNINAIREIQKQGNMVVISSGRSYQDTQQILRQADISCPFITGNGAKLNQANRPPHTLCLSANKVSEMIEVIEKSGLYYEIYTKDGILIKEDGKETLYQEIEVMKQYMSGSLRWAAEIVDIQYNQHGLIFVSNYQDIDFTNLEVYKIFVLSFDKSRLHKLRELLVGRNDISLTSSGEQKLEIGHPEANKGNALVFLANNLGIPLDDTIAIGDNLNDLPMFKVAGKSIAMGNAENEVKEQSTYVTKPYNEDGVAVAMEKYIF